MTTQPTTPTPENATTGPHGGKELTWRERNDRDKAARKLRKLRKLRDRLRILAWHMSSEADRRSIFGGPGDVITENGRTYRIANDGSWRRVDG